MFDFQYHCSVTILLKLVRWRDHSFTKGSIASVYSYWGRFTCNVPITSILFECKSAYYVPFIGDIRSYTKITESEILKILFFEIHSSQWLVANERYLPASWYLSKFLVATAELNRHLPWTTICQFFKFGKILFEHFYLRMLEIKFLILHFRCYFATIQMFGFGPDFDHLTHRNTV